MDPVEEKNQRSKMNRVSLKKKSNGSPIFIFSIKIRYLRKTYGEVFLFLLERGATHKADFAICGIFHNEPSYGSSNSTFRLYTHLFFFVAFSSISISFPVFIINIMRMPI